MPCLNVNANLFKYVFRTSRQTFLLSVMSTVGTKIHPSNLLTASLFKSHIYISEELCISLRRIYQQSLMEINCCKWSNSCEAANQKASQGQVWEISTITTGSADLYTVCSQSALRLLQHSPESPHESLFFSSESFETTQSGVNTASRNARPATPKHRYHHLLKVVRQTHLSCMLFTFQDDFPEVEARLFDITPNGEGVGVAEMASP